jgi:hypothetical protein
VWNHHVLGWRPQPCVSSFQLDVGCPVVIAAASNRRMFCTGSSPTCIRRHNMSQIFSKGFTSGLMGGQGTQVTASLWRYAVIAHERSGLVLLSIYTGIIASGWLAKWGTTTGCKTSLMYLSPVRLFCMVAKSSLQSWEIHPKSLLSLHWKGQLAGCSVVYRMYFCVSTPYPAVGYTKKIPSDQWIFRHVFKFQPRRATYHAKRVRRCRSNNSGRLMTLLDLSPADFRLFLTVLVDIRLLGSQCFLRTELVANGKRLTKRYNALSSRSDATCGLSDLDNLSYCWFVCFHTSPMTTV